MPSYKGNYCKKIESILVKVLFISRSNLFIDKGGDTVQLVNTAAHLEKLSVKVDIKLSDETIDYSSYDLLHFFNIIRPADILYHIARSNKPFVVSTIYVDYSEYEKKNREGLAGWLFRVLSRDAIEYIKVIARAIFGSEKIRSFSYLFIGHKNSVKKIIRNSSLLLPNSNNEYKRLLLHYGINQTYKVIPNAIDPKLFENSERTTIKNQKLILCVGRIEGRKNQLNLIRALRNSSFQLVIIGSPAPNQANYFKACKEAASANIEFINILPQRELLAYYTRAKVHVLPSWFETTGLTSLEAAVMGCNIVISEKGDTREYFEDMAYYCDPASPESIKNAIIEASNNSFNERLRKKILTHYIWTVTAKKTLEAYCEVLH